jgi:hypothetical protein
MRTRARDKGFNHPILLMMNENIGGNGALGLGLG